jgi:mono/diheme cytochrome c family protein
MLALGFVALFLVIGLSVFFVAFRGGPRALPTTTADRRRRIPRPFLLLVGVVCLAFGVGLPAFSLAYNHGSQADSGRGGVELTANQKSGRGLFVRTCATCHTLADAGAVGRVGPNLDNLRPPAALALNAIKLGRARGQGQMPALLLTGTDARDVADYVAAVAGR